MPKSDSADTLLKRLQKIKRAQGRLGDITTRIRTQADTLAELLKVAQAFVSERSAAKPVATRKPAAPKRTTAKRAAAPRSGAAAKPLTPKPPAPKRTNAKRTTAKRTAVRRRAPTKPASA